MFSKVDFCSNIYTNDAAAEEIFSFELPESFLCAGSTHFGDGNSPGRDCLC